MSAPDTAAILAESGVNTADAFVGLWTDLQGSKSDFARSLQATKDILQPKILASAPAGNTDNLALAGSSVIHFTGATAFNLTGLVAPEKGTARIIIMHVSGAGTVTLKHLITSVATNQLSLITAADTALATRKSAIFVYLSSLWRQIL